MFTYSSKSMSLVCTPPYIYLSRVFAFSRPTMANSTPIRRLPVELITEIFGSLDSIADVTHLARTSKFFRDIWNLHTVTICGAILPCKIASYEQVSELAIAVIRQKLGHGGPAQISDDSPINKARVTVWISRAAGLQIQKYESAFDRVPCSCACSPDPRLSRNPSDDEPREPVTHDPRHPVKLCAHEQSDFLNLYYKLWMLTTMPRASAEAVLESMPPSQLNPLRKLGDLRIIQPTGLERVSTDNPDKYWAQKLDVLSRCFEVHFRRAILPPPRCWRTIMAAYEGHSLSAGEMSQVVFLNGLSGKKGQ